MVGNSATKACVCDVGYYSLNRSWGNATQADTRMCQECAAIEVQQCKDSWPEGPCLDGINLGEATIWDSPKACPGGPAASAFICPLSGLWIEPGSHPPDTLSLIPCEGSYQCAGPDAQSKPNCSKEMQFQAQCGPHHTGFLCAECEASYSKVAGKCVYCDAVDWVTLATQVLSSMGMGCFLLWKSLKVVPTPSQAKDVFNALDQDGGGALDRGEIKNLLGSMGDPLYSWNRCLNKHVKKMVGSESFSRAKVLGRVKAMFDERDEQGNGTLPTEKVRDLLQAIGLKLKGSSKEAAWKEASDSLTKAMSDTETDAPEISWDDFKEWYEGPRLSEKGDYYDVLGVARSLFDKLGGKQGIDSLPKGQLEKLLKEMEDRVGKKTCCGLRSDKDKKRWKRASKEFIEDAGDEISWVDFSRWYQGQGQGQLNASRFSHYIDVRAVPPQKKSFGGELLRPSKELELEVSLEQFEAWCAVSQPSAAMGIFIFFTQTFGVIAQESELFGMLDVLNFDVEDALGKCLAPDMPLMMSLALVILSPLGAGITVCLVYWMITSSRCSCCHNVAKSTNKPRLQAHHLHRAFVNVSLLAFAPLTRRCVSVLLCRYVHARDKQYLVEDMSIVCYEGHHFHVALVSVVTLIAYAGGLPALLMRKVKTAINKDTTNLREYRQAQLEAHLFALGVEYSDTRDDVVYELRKLMGKAQGVDMDDSVALQHVIVSMDDWLGLNSVERGEILTQVARKMGQRKGVEEHRAGLDKLRISREQLDVYLKGIGISDHKTEIITSCLSLHNVHSLDGERAAASPGLQRAHLILPLTAFLRPCVFVVAVPLIVPCLVCHRLARSDH